MKTLTLKLIVAFLFIASSISAQNFNNASEYLDFVSEEQQEITKNMWKYTKAVAHSKSDRSIDGKRKKLLKTIDQAIAKIKKANGFGDDDYKSKVLRHMTFNKNLFKIICNM